MVRGGTLRDGLTYTAQVGWNVSPRVTVAANVKGMEPYSHAARGVALGSPVGLSDRVTYLNYGPTVIVRLGPRFGLQLDVDATARARNLARGLTYRVGFSHVR